MSNSRTLGGFWMCSWKILLLEFIDLKYNTITLFKNEFFKIFNADERCGTMVTL